MTLFKLFFLLPLVNVQSIVAQTISLSQPFNLIQHHSKSVQYFKLESKVIKYKPDGNIMETAIYRLFLRCNPGTVNGDQYTCTKYEFEIAGNGIKEIPSLIDYTYILQFNRADTAGQLFGVDHRRFETLKDNSGKTMEIENTYHVYNSFIDFHSMQVFSERSERDSDVQKLTHIGDSVVHFSSYSSPPVNLGNQVKPGSYFKNGKVTLSFKGIGFVNRKNCGIIEYDSGNSSFLMIMTPLQQMEITTTGSSHYWGDIYKDLSGGWIQKATLHELVVSETKVPVLPNKISSTIERTILIENITNQ